MAGKNILTEEFYVSEIHRFIKEFGKVPTYLEMDKAKGYPSGSAYSKNIGWNNALKKANVRIHRGWNGVEKYTKEDIINILKEFEEKEGRVPCYRDMVASNGYPEVSHIKKYIEEENNVRPKKMSFFQPRKGQLAYRISYTNSQWYKDLHSYGILERKSFVTRIPFQILKTREEAAAVSRGIFDGDGGITYRKYKEIYKPVFTIHGTAQFCRDYSYLLYNYCNIMGIINKDKSISRFRVEGFSNCQKVYDFLYGHDNFYIERKKERFEKLLNRTFSLESDNY